MKKAERVLVEFQRLVSKHHGEQPQPGEPNCMYWIKHADAALIVAALTHGSRRADLNSTIQGWYLNLAVKIAEQWNKYERLAGTDNSDSPDSQKPQEGQN